MTKNMRNFLFEEQNEERKNTSYFAKKKERKEQQCYDLILQKNHRITSEKDASAEEEGKGEEGTEHHR